MSIYFQHSQFIQPESAIKHGFFGSRGGVSRGLYTSLNCVLGSEDDSANVHANRMIALEALGLEKTTLHNVHQIHSAICHTVDEAYIKKKSVLEGDALVTDMAEHTISILTADCAPVLFYGQKAEGAPVIGAAHAGWKGAVGGVLENTVHAMVQKGAVLNTIKAVIGPTIGPESYEVGAEFKDNLIQKDQDYDPHFRQNGGKIFFDLPSFCEQRLSNAGVQNVFHQNLDTFLNEGDFFSYRRATHRKDKDCGRQISMISIG